MNFSKMKHSKKLFLIPEELYRTLFASATEKNNGTPLSMLRSRLNRLSTMPPGEMSADERAIKYNQEFKRYSKLRKEEQDRPLNVRLQNVEEVAAALPPAASAPISRIPRQKKRKLMSDFDMDSSDTGAGLYEGESPFESASENPLAGMRMKAMKYISKNFEKLGLNKSGQIMQLTKGSTSPIPIVTSNVSTIIDHILQHGGVRRKPLPVGYEKFMERVNDDAQLLKILNIKMQGGRGMAKSKKVHKKAKNSTFPQPFAFKPRLWH